MIMSLFLLYSEKNSIKDILSLFVILRFLLENTKYFCYRIPSFSFFFFLCLFLKMWRLILCFRKFLIRKEGMHYLGK